MEGQHFESNGFELNPVIRMAIMRKESLFVDVESISHMINNYNDIINSLEKSEVNYIGSHDYAEK